MSVEREVAATIPASDVKSVDVNKRVTNPLPGAQNTEAPTVDNSETVLTAQEGVTSRQQASQVGENEVLSRFERKQRLVQVLDRGVVGDRLRVDLPSDVYGEWVRNDPLEINRMQLLGFKVDRVYAPSRAIHASGTEAAIIGDVIFMTTTRENKELIDEVKAEQIKRFHAPQNDKQQEDSTFERTTADGTSRVVPTFAEGRVREARKDEIAAALNLPQGS